MASGPSSFLSAPPLFSASAVANSPWPSSTPLWVLFLLLFIPLIFVTGCIVSCCCVGCYLGISLALRATRRRVAPFVASTTFQYNEEEPVGKNTECCVCLDDFKNGDLCKMLSTCHHNFHEPCINHWLKMRSHCPLCRVSVRRKLRPDRTQTCERSSSSDSTRYPPV